MTNLERAIKDGYAHIIGEKGKEKITYVSSDNHVENYSDPEEKVRAEFWAELIYKYEYPVNRIKIEVTVPDRLPTDRADIVVFRDDECKRPYAVVECKKDGVTDAEFNQAIEQGVGNATWVKLRADYVVIIAGGTRRVLDVTDKFGALEREQNILADLPHAYGKPQEFRFYKGSENDIKPVDREDLIAAIKKCHQTLWGGGRLSPPTAFGELCKLIFVKISDEQKPRKKGEPYQFQIKTHEPASKLAERINALYDEQKKKDPEVFTDSIKVDDRVLRTVVSHLEAINLHETDLDVKGVAFEQFMDGFFKGDFGQYFTPRPIIEFAVKMTAPEHDWDVLDTSCGSGGFLLYALDYIRHQATEYYEKGSADHYRYWHDFAEKHLYGIEINDEIARVAKMNMIVHDDGHTNVISYDALESIDKIVAHNPGFQKDKFDLILTNPPFGSTVNGAEKPYLSTFELGNTYDKKGKAKPKKNQSSEVLFVERICEFLKPGTGKAAIVLPDGILTNSSSQYVRDFILERFQLLAVISLPKDAFAHFGAGVNASVVFLRKKNHDEVTDYDPVFMAKPIFHNINSKAVPLKSEQLLKSVLIQQHDGLDFNDRELIEKFGPEYLLARKILSANPLIVRKLGYIEWIHPRILSTLVDLINYVQEKSGTRIETLEQQEALINSLNNTLRHAHPLGAATLQMASGLLFLLVYMYYQMENGELDPQNKAEKEKNQLIAWAEKYNITDAQHDIEQYAAVNADCIRAIFDKYVLSTEQTIFMSRCFDSRFDENERAIRRAIECVNREKGSSLRLLRVDQHSEGATGQISDRILRDIEMSGLVIADLSSGRANIPHEIGFAMGLKKGLILIHNGTDAEADEHTPSNIKMYEQIRFNQDYHKLETELKAKLIDYYKL